MTYEDAYAYLLALPRFGDRGAAAYKPGLERIRGLLDAMGHPERAFPSVHVAGTNGKGSTASLLAAVATAAGRRTGLHTSPHLYRMTERLRVDGVPAPESWAAAAVARYRGRIEETEASFFEVTVALSFLYFAEQAVDLAVVEVGMGGRLDATNVLQPALAVITAIGYDHREYLGETLEAIAGEKAGIVKPGVPVVAAPNPPSVTAVLRAAAAERGAPWHPVDDETTAGPARTAPDGLRFDARTPVRAYPGLTVGLPAAYQQDNARTALRSAELLAARGLLGPGDPLDQAPASSPLYRGFQDVRALSGVRGRFDVLRVEPLIVADVGHNSEGLAVSLNALRQLRDNRPGRLYVVFGLMRDKDVHQIARLLAAHRAQVALVPIHAERALPPEELAGLLAGYGIPVLGIRSVSESLVDFCSVATSHDALLITGSHQVVAQIPESLLPVLPAGSIAADRDAGRTGSSAPEPRDV